jgi:hypothetical protein
VVHRHAPPKKSDKLRKGLLIALGIGVAFDIIGYLALKEWEDKSKVSSESTTAAVTTTPTTGSTTAAVTTTPSTESTTTAVTTTPPGYISEATWTEGEWPFTVSEGVLLCTNAGSLPWQVTFTANGVTYAANVTALLAHQYADMTVIMRDSPTIPGTKINLRPVIQRGLALCGR